MAARLCELCGKPIENGHPQAEYCNECRSELNSAHWSESRVRQKHKNKKKPTLPTISEINECAIGLGMTYGKYVSKYGYRLVKKED